MMMFDSFPHRFAVGKYAYDFGADFGVHPDQEKFIVGERAGLVQNALRHKNLAYIVYASSIHEVGYFIRRQPKCTRNNLRVASH